MSEIIPFYSHTTTKYKCFSQFYPSKFTIDAITYNCAEQWMMASKARTFIGNDAILANILLADNPVAIKSYGRAVKNYDDNIWTNIRYDIVVKGNYAKFSQNKELKQLLLDTKDAILVEASKYDKVWGVGLDMHNVDIKDQTKWKGLNLLGKALMQVRNDISK